MTAHLLPGAQHEDMWELIPWLVNGRLSGESAAALSAHLDECAECAREYQDQLRIYSAMQADDSIAFASEASFQKLATRLDAASQFERASRKVRSYAAAGVLAALGLAAWGAWSVHRMPASATAAYRTLTSPALVGVAGAQVRVVFTPNLTLSELARLLHSIDANITGGPTEAGVYTLGFGPSLNSSAQVAQRLALLRANDNVRFAEPVTAAP
jgi:anti-sigma factor RsiW